MMNIAIDPGERWTGIAIIEDDEAFSYLIDGKDDLFLAADWLQRMLMMNLIGTVAAEDYRIRAAGHQLGKQAKTPRLLGALEFVTTRCRQWTWETYPPGNIDRDLKQMKIRKLLRAWAQAAWGSTKEHDHVYSAWRIMGWSLIQDDPDRLQLLGASTRIVHKTKISRPLHIVPEGVVIASRVRLTL